MDKELIKKLVAQGKAYVLDLRGGSVPYKEGNAAAVDFYCPQDVVLNMPWVKMGRGHINLYLGIELPKGVGLDIRSRSGFTDKGMEVDVAFIGKNETQVGYMTNVRADIDICLGLSMKTIETILVRFIELIPTVICRQRIANSN